jgi:hypothetical protein
VNHTYLPELRGDERRVTLPDEQPAQPPFDWRTALEFFVLGAILGAVIVGALA